MGLRQFIAAAFFPCDRCSAPELPTTRDRGAYGEKVAAQFLRRLGIKTLYRNYRVMGGEIDLICRDGEMLVFVEVKARKSDHWGQPGEAVDFKKQMRIMKAVRSYLRELGDLEPPWRLDIVEVFLECGKIPECRHIRDADIRQSR